MSIQFIGILLVYIAAIILIATRKLPTIIVLPLMAVAMCLVAGVPVIGGEFNIVTNVISGGVMRLSSAMTGVIFGAFFGQVLRKTGVTATIIRKAAEMAGDKPLPIALALLAAGSFVFAGANGLGMVILVGSIILPIMISVGISPATAGLVLLCANAIGSVFTIGPLAIYTSILGVTTQELVSWSWIPAIPFILVCVVMIVWQMKKDKVAVKAWAMPTEQEADTNQKNVPLIAMITPIVPILLVMIAKMDIVPSIIIGVLVTLLLTWGKKPAQVITSSLVEGIQDAAGPLALMIGIGMLMMMVSAAPVKAILEPVVGQLIPTNPFVYVIVFTLLACLLTVYRGPMNFSGLGSGLIALFFACGMNPIMTMVTFRIAGNVQCLCDPTNTHHVWTADYAKEDVNRYFIGTLPWVAVSVLLSFILAAIALF